VSIDHDQPVGVGRGGARIRKVFRLMALTPSTLRMDKEKTATAVNFQCFQNE
jgi:hypothetical protein